jgi:hypothetical protein
LGIGYETKQYQVTVAQITSVVAITSVDAADVSPVAVQRDRAAWFPSGLPALTFIVIGELQRLEVAAFEPEVV